MNKNDDDDNIDDDDTDGNDHDDNDKDETLSKVLKDEFRSLISPYRRLYF